MFVSLYFCQRQYCYLNFVTNLFQEEIAEMEEKIKERQIVLDDRLPPFQEKENIFEETTKDYEAMKKQIVGKLSRAGNDCYRLLIRVVEYFSYSKKK